MEPGRYLISAKLRDGTAIVIRSIRAEDGDSLRTQFKFLSPDSVRLRFHGLRRSPTENQAIDLAKIDFVDHVALVATLQSNSEELIGVGRYIVCTEDKSLHRAEIAFVVLDDYQGKGIGSLLLKHLGILARLQGLTHFQADVLADNYRMIKVFEHSGFAVTRSIEGGVMRLQVTIAGHEQSGSN